MRCRGVARHVQTVAVRLSAIRAARESGAAADGEAIAVTRIEEDGMTVGPSITLDLGRHLCAGAGGHATGEGLQRAAVARQSRGKILAARVDELLVVVPCAALPDLTVRTGCPSHAVGRTRGSAGASAGTGTRASRAASARARSAARASCSGSGVCTCRSPRRAASRRATRGFSSCTRESTRAGLATRFCRTPGVRSTLVHTSGAGSSIRTFGAGSSIRVSGVASPGRRRGAGASAGVGPCSAVVRSSASTAPRAQEFSVVAACGDGATQERRSHEKPRNDFLHLP
jgi:hypothetical protein